MIVRIKVKEKEQIDIMLFGNSYKTWDEQFQEYCRMYKPEILEIATSPEKWKSWGGLKWCKEECFQHELNREGCQENEPDNPKPRKYENMRFVENRIVENMGRKIAKKYQL